MHEGISTAARRDTAGRHRKRSGGSGADDGPRPSAGALMEVVQYPEERRQATGIPVRRRRTVVVDPRPAGEVFEPGAARV